MQFLNRGNHKVIWLDGNPLVDEEVTLLTNTQNRTRVLSISNMGLTNISRLSLFLFPNLEVLNMSGNDITMFDVSAMSEQDRLVSIDLSNNDIVDFVGNFSAELPKLVTLLLSDNDIQTIPSDVRDLFHHLNVLTLRDNPLHCNCELKWLSEWLVLVKGQLKSELPYITCQTPENKNKTQAGLYCFLYRPL